MAQKYSFPSRAKSTKPELPVDETPVVPEIVETVETVEVIEQQPIKQEEVKMEANMSEAQTAAVEAPVVVGSEEKKTRTRNIGRQVKVPEDYLYIIHNYAVKKMEDICSETGLMKNQITAIVSKFRKGLNEKLEDPNLSQEEKEDTEKKLEMFTKRGGSGKKQPGVRQASKSFIDSFINDALAGL